MLSRVIHHTLFLHNILYCHWWKYFVTIVFSYFNSLISKYSFMWLHATKFSAHAPSSLTDLLLFPRFYFQFSSIQCLLCLLLLFSIILWLYLSWNKQCKKIHTIWNSSFLPISCRNSHVSYLYYLFFTNHWHY